MSASIPTAKRKPVPSKSGESPKDIAGWGECTNCPLRGKGICAALLHGHGNFPGLLRREECLRARQNLYRAQDKSRHVAIIREGGIFRYTVVPDGRRQILSFGLPGDLVSSSFILRESTNFSIQALTPVRLCVFDRLEFGAFIVADSEALRTFLEICVSEKEKYEARIVDLGRRTADERIARMIVHTATRLGWTGEDGFSFAFPVRQQHIADMLGLTQVHVSRVIGKFRRAGLVTLGAGKLEIGDARGLRKIAGTRNH